MLVVNRTITIPRSDLELTFVRSSGPGGQNVNKVNSKAVLRFAAAGSAALPHDVRARFLARYASRLTGDGSLILTSQKYRDQAKNVADVQQRLRTMVLAIVAPPKKRRATKPTRASVARRIESKQARGKTKQNRRKIDEE